MSSRPTKSNHAPGVSGVTRAMNPMQIKLIPPAIFRNFISTVYPDFSQIEGVQYAHGRKHRGRRRGNHFSYTQYRIHQFCTTCAACSLYASVFKSAGRKQPKCCLLKRSRDVVGPTQLGPSSSKLLPTVCRLLCICIRSGTT